MCSISKKARVFKLMKKYFARGKSGLFETKYAPVSLKLCNNIPDLINN